MKKTALALMFTAVVSNALFVSASYAEGPGSNGNPQQQQWKPGGQGQGQRPGGGQGQGPGGGQGQRPNHQGGDQGRPGGNQGRPEAHNDRGPGQSHPGARPGPQQREHFAFGGHDFRRGHPVPRDFRWDRYRVDDWRARGLYAPPDGYRWAYIDGNYVLIAVATGVITSIILNSVLH